MLRIESSAFFIRSIRLLEMKVTAAQAAQACYDLYDYGIEPSKTQWDFISMTGADCYYGVTMVGPTALCCFRGTSTLPDLLRALESTARVPPPSKQFNTAALGPVHPGAWQGLEEALASVVKDHHWSDIQFTGHSQGAMRATLATAAFAATFATATVQPRIVFGECKSGYIKSALFADIPGSASFLATDGWISDPLYAYPFSFWSG